jgi:hypothetical protein
MSRVPTIILSHFVAGLTIMQGTANTPAFLIYATPYPCFIPCYDSSKCHYPCNIPCFDFENANTPALSRAIK